MITSNTVGDTESENVSASDKDAPNMMKKIAWRPLMIAATPSLQHIQYAIYQTSVQFTFNQSNALRLLPNEKVETVPIQYTAVAWW